MTLIAGLDETGLGSWAGPLVIVVAAFPKDASSPAGVCDSKKIKSRVKRTDVLSRILPAASWVGYGWSTAQDIDVLGVRRAWLQAAWRALEGAPLFELLIVDGERRVYPYEGKQSVVIRGDDLHWQVGAASIIAKVTRDREMEYLAQYHPDFGWERNSGYGTTEHQAAIRASGCSPLHRLSFVPAALQVDARLRRVVSNAARSLSTGEL